MSVNSVSLNLSQSDFTTHFKTGTIIDSGTTYTYLATKVYSSLFNGLSEFCKKKGNCNGETERVYGEPHECYKYDPNVYTNIEDFFATFPNFTFTMKEANVN